MNDNDLDTRLNFALGMYFLHALMCLALSSDGWWPMALMLPAAGMVFPFGKGGDFDRLLAWWRRSRNAN